jgi:hypothetical protein
MGFFRLVMMIYDLLRFTAPTTDVPNASEARKQMLMQLGMAVVLATLLIGSVLLYFVRPMLLESTALASVEAPRSHFDPWAKEGPKSK